MEPVSSTTTTTTTTTTKASGADIIAAAGRYESRILMILLASLTGAILIGAGIAIAYTIYTKRQLAQERRAMVLEQNLSRTGGLAGGARAGGAGGFTSNLSLTDDAAKLRAQLIAENEALENQLQSYLRTIPNQ